MREKKECRKRRGWSSRREREKKGCRKRRGWSSRREREKKACRKRRGWSSRFIVVLFVQIAREHLMRWSGATWVLVMVYVFVELECAADGKNVLCKSEVRVMAKQV